MQNPDVRRCVSRMNMVRRAAWACLPPPAATRRTGQAMARRGRTTRRRAPRNAPAGRSAGTGPETAPGAASGRPLSRSAGEPPPGSGCAASRPSGSASPPETPTARLPGSASAQPSRPASPPSAPPRSFARPGIGEGRARHATGPSSATMPDGDRSSRSRAVRSDRCRVWHRAWSGLDMLPKCTVGPAMRIPGICRARKADPAREFPGRIG